MYHETETQPLAHCFLPSERESVVNHRYVRIECIYLEFLTNGLASWTANLPFKVYTIVTVQYRHERSIGFFTTPETMKHNSTF